jgi:hypothetical protein
MLHARIFQAESQRCQWPTQASSAAATQNHPHLHNTQCLTPLVQGPDHMATQPVVVLTAAIDTHSKGSSSEWLPVLSHLVVAGSHINHLAWHAVFQLTPETRCSILLSPAQHSKALISLPGS